MSQTIAITIRNLRDMLNDDDFEQPIVHPRKYVTTVIRHAQQLGERWGAATTWVSGKLSATAGSTADATVSTISTGIAYQSILDIRDTVNGRMLEKKSQDEINDMRRGIISGSNPQGDPLFYAMWEDGAQTVTVRWSCVPVRTIAMDILYLAMNSDTVTAANTLNFAPAACRSIECACASEIFKSLTDEERMRTQLGERVVEAWNAFVERGVKLEYERKARLKRRPYGVGAILGS